MLEDPPRSSAMARLWLHASAATSGRPWAVMRLILGLACALVSGVGSGFDIQFAGVGLWFGFDVRFGFDFRVGGWLRGQDFRCLTLESSQNPRTACFLGLLDLCSKVWR